jgi:hypothetical protein
MVEVLAIIAVLLLIAVGAGIRSRGRAAERAAVARERRDIAGQLSDQRREREAAERTEPRFARLGDAAEPRGGVEQHH